MKKVPVLLLGIALAMPAALARTPRDYAWLFPLQLPSASTNNAWRVELTPAVYAHVHDPTLRDIAVFNADGQLVPLARESRAPVTTEHEIRATVPMLALPAATMPSGNGADLHLLVERDGSGRLRRLDLHEADGTPAASAGARDWLLDASALDGTLEQLDLNWDSPQGDVVARFALSTSDDLQNWRPLASGTVFALQQGGDRLDRHDLALGGVRARYLRLQRSDTGAALQGLRAQIRCRSRSDEVPPLVWVDAQSVAADAATADDAAGTTQRFDYALPATLPVERVRIELASDNSVARFAIAGSNGGRTTPLAQATAFRLDNGGNSLRNDDVRLASDTRLGRLQLRTGAPLATSPRVQVAFRPDRFVFLAEGKPPYSLVVGSASARLPDYPVDAALASLRAQLGAQWQPPLATIGSGVPSGGDSVLKAPPVPISWSRWLLWITLLAGTVLVGALALGMLREPRR